MDEVDRRNLSSTNFPYDLTFSWSVPSKPPYLRRMLHESYDNTENLWSKACFVIEGGKERLEGGSVKWGT